MTKGMIAAGFNDGRLHRVVTRDGFRVRNYIIRWIFRSRANAKPCKMSPPPSMCFLPYEIRFRPHAFGLRSRETPRRRAILQSRRKLPYFRLKYSETDSRCRALCLMSKREKTTRGSFIALGDYRRVDQKFTADLYSNAHKYYRSNDITADLASRMSARSLACLLNFHVAGQ